MNKYTIHLVNGDGVVVRGVMTTSDDTVTVTEKGGKAYVFPSASVLYWTVSA